MTSDLWKNLKNQNSIGNFQGIVSLRNWFSSDFHMKPFEIWVPLVSMTCGKVFKKLQLDRDPPPRGRSTFQLIFRWKLSRFRFPWYPWLVEKSHKNHNSVWNFQEVVPICNWFSDKPVRDLKTVRDLDSHDIHDLWKNLKNQFPKMKFCHNK